MAKSILLEWPEGISFMKSDNIQATPSSFFYKSSLTLINEVEMGREEGMGMEGRERKSCRLCWGMTVRWRGGEGEDTSSLAGLSGSITFGELLSTPVWQLYHRGGKERREKRGVEKARKGVLKKTLYLPLSLFVL